MKICKICKMEKTDDNFYIDIRYKDGYVSECKSCRSEYRKRHYKNNKESINLKCKIYSSSHKKEKQINNKIYYQKNKGLLLNNSYVYLRNRKYGITQEIYDDIFNRQNGVCAICGLPETATGRITKRLRPLSVDHDHKTKKIRGLLCKKCNVGLGLFMDSKELLIKAINYLEKIYQ